MDRGVPKADAASMQGALDTRQENGRVMPAVNANLNLLASSSRNAATASETYQVVRGRGTESSLTPMPLGVLNRSPSCSKAIETGSA